MLKGQSQAANPQADGAKMVPALAAMAGAFFFQGAPKNHKSCSEALDARNMSSMGEWPTSYGKWFLRVFASYYTQQPTPFGTSKQELCDFFTSNCQ